jgi:uncharacterized protein (TIGR03032 family)
VSRAAALEPRWAEHASAWRDPAAVVAWSESAPLVDSVALRARVRGRFWEALAERDLTLIVTREYEHLVLGLAAPGGQPHATHLSLPHPSGVAFDPERGLVHIAATRNPNQLVTLAPLAAVRERGDLPIDPPPGRPLMPVRTRFLPGCLYLHDLALVGGVLHGNAVGENAVVRFDGDGGVERVWWPRTIEGPEGPDFSRNYLQLNSIAAGESIEASFFSASADRPGRLRPGHRRFPVDRRGVIMSGATRDTVVRGLTRPHSARLHKGQLWVANSGYGELGLCTDGSFEPQLRLRGWTRGLCFAGDIACVATSRVIPRFAQYAPGLDVNRSECAVHIVDPVRAEVLGSLVWPAGNQIFAIEAVPSAFTAGFVREGTRRPSARDMARLYYSFDVEENQHP